MGIPITNVVFISITNKFMKWNKYTQIISSTVSFFLFNALHKTCIEFDVRLCSLFDNLDELQNAHPEFYEQLAIVR